MPVSRFLSVTAFAALLSLTKSQTDTGTIFNPDSICYSYGVDFVDEGHYFINSQSTEQFSAVSTFKGCNSGEADILLVDPNDIEYLCDDIATTPDDTKQLSKCPIQKDQMSSGHWLLLILGNNGDYPAQPFAWQRGTYHPAMHSPLSNINRSLPHCRHTSDQYIHTDNDGYILRHSHHH
jgi:hypothetical protein